MKRFWLIALVVMLGGLVVVLGRRRMEQRRELAFREELETIPSSTS